MVAKSKAAPAPATPKFTDEDPAHVLIIEARFYEEIADEMAAGVIRELNKAGATHDRIAVPGCLEIPAALSMAMGAMEASDAITHDGYVVLGCVVRGETSHYDIVINESNRAVMNLVIDGQLALGNGILTVETLDQAWERAKRDKMDKGGDAARACLRMIELRRAFEAQILAAEDDN